MAELMQRFLNRCAGRRAYSLTTKIAEVYQDRGLRPSKELFQTCCFCGSGRVKANGLFGGEEVWLTGMKGQPGGG